MPTLINPCFLSRLLSPSAKDKKWINYTSVRGGAVPWRGAKNWGRGIKVVLLLRQLRPPTRSRISALLHLQFISKGFAMSLTQHLVFSALPSPLSLLSNFQNSDAIASCPFLPISFDGVLQEVKLDAFISSIHHFYLEPTDKHSKRNEIPLSNKY